MNTTTYEHPIQPSMNKPPVYEFFDDYTSYEAKKQEVRNGSHLPGTRIVHMTPNQEGCESAVLDIVNGERILIITGYYDY